MKRKLLLATLGIAGTLIAATDAAAQVAGSSTTGATVTAVSQLAPGWSVRKSILGRTLYTDSGEKIGNVQDLIIAPDKSASYLIVGAGGFVGIGRHDVAIPVTQVAERAGKLVMPGATKDVVGTLPSFNYADDTARRDQMIAGAEQDIAKANSQLAVLQQNAVAATSDAKAKIALQVADLKLDVKSTEEKLAEARKAGVHRWKEFEGDLNAATVRLRKSLDAATG